VSQNCRLLQIGLKAIDPGMKLPFLKASMEPSIGVHARPAELTVKTPYEWEGLIWPSELTF